MIAITVKNYQDGMIAITVKNYQDGMIAITVKNYQDGMIAITVKNYQHVLNLYRCSFFVAFSAQQSQKGPL